MNDLAVPPQTEGLGHKSEAEDSVDNLDAYDDLYDGEPKVVAQEFSYPTHMDPRRGVSGSDGPYLDDVERERAEVIRARQENREPDLDNPPAIQGTPLIPTHVLKSQVPGDYEVPVDVVAPVVVGKRPEKKSSR